MSIMQSAKFYVIEYKNYDWERNENDPPPDPDYFLDIKVALACLMKHIDDEFVQSTLYGLSEDEVDQPLKKSDPININMDKLTTLMFSKMDIAEIESCVTKK